MLAEWNVPDLTTLEYEPRNFRDLYSTDVGQELWKFMKRPDNVVRMETATFLDRAAVEPLAPGLLAEFGYEIGEARFKQMIGHMARQIMEAVGYEIERPNLRIIRENLFSSAARYCRPGNKRDRSMQITREIREAWRMKMSTFPTTFVSADWSKDERKRSVHVADLRGRRIRQVRQEGAGWRLDTILALARKQDGPVLIGLDLALGVPDSYWCEVLKTGDRPASFIEWLCRLDPDSDFFEKIAGCAEEWQVDRPFFRIPPGAGMKKAYDNLLPGGFLRKIDRLTGAKPIFAVSGIPGTVGSGTLALWKELIPLLRKDRDFAIWPFEGDLVELFSRKKIVLAEIYPGIAYAAALAEDLPTGPIRVGKTKCEKRDRACDLLEKAGWILANNVDLGELRSARIDEDAFDSLFPAAAVLRCAIEGRTFFSSRWIDQVEGGMLLVGPVDPCRPATSL